MQGYKLLMTGSHTEESCKENQVPHTTGLDLSATMWVMIGKFKMAMPTDNSTTVLQPIMWTSFFLKENLFVIVLKSLSRRLLHRNHKNSLLQSLLFPTPLKRPSLYQQVDGKPTLWSVRFPLLYLLTDECLQFNPNANSKRLERKAQFDCLRVINPTP